jgi:hypothetical protein
MSEVITCVSAGQKAIQHTEPQIVKSHETASADGIACSSIATYLHAARALQQAGRLHVSEQAAVFEMLRQVQGMVKHHQLQVVVLTVVVLDQRVQGAGTALVLPL